MFAVSTVKAGPDAVFQAGAEWHVYQVSGGKAHTRQVETGKRSASEVEILRGLDEGDAVILHPSNQLAEGARVEELE